jgi:hypothetical protein
VILSAPSPVDSQAGKTSSSNQQNSQQIHKFRKWEEYLQCNKVILLKSTKSQQSYKVTTNLQIIKIQKMWEDYLQCNTTQDSTDVPLVRG